MEQNAKIYVAGHRGLVGGAILRKLRDEGYSNLIVRSHAELDLLRQDEVDAFFEKEKCEYVFLAAAKVGGIGANSEFPADFIYQNTMIGFNVVNAAYKNGVKKLINLGSSCIYPKLAPQPLKEEYLLTGSLEITNEAYAAAKISVIKLCAYYNKQYGTNFLSVMPTNLYGTGDNYEKDTSHVIPALIRKFHEAKISGADNVTLWGDGSPRREFLYSDDLADALLLLMRKYNAKDLSSSAGDFVNIGCGKDLTIKELALIIRDIVYEDTAGRVCRIEWDKSKPNGTPRKLLDVSKITALGYKPKTDLERGIKLAYQDFVKKNGINSNNKIL
ncbi:MAG: GDP-L-fucose synthase [Spirochaetaceae bacterium]|nr:GDP-L-fucose synthase [Spirochaetaceae bacterium]